MKLKRFTMVHSARLVLLLICLVCIVPDVSARPSKEHHSKVRLMDHLFGRRQPTAAAAVVAAPGRHHHSTGHQHQRRSVDYEDLYDADYKRVQQCYEDEQINELCQRCSKVTKSGLVFPMCCSNEDETRTWCHDYVYYGIQT